MYTLQKSNPDKTLWNAAWNTLLPGETPAEGHDFELVLLEAAITACVKSCHGVLLIGLAHGNRPEC